MSFVVRFRVPRIVFSAKWVGQHENLNLAAKGLLLHLAHGEAPQDEYLDIETLAAEFGTEETARAVEDLVRSQIAFVDISE